MSVEFPLPTTTQGNDRCLGYLAGSLEIGYQLLHVAARSITFASLSWVAEIHDCVLGGVAEKTSSIQFCNCIAGGNGLKVRSGLFVDGGQSGNLRVHVIFLGFCSGGLRMMLASGAISCFGRIFVTVFTLGICS